MRAVTGGREAHECAAGDLLVHVVADRQGCDDVVGGLQHQGGQLQSREVGAVVGGDDDAEPTGLGIPGAYTPPHIRLRRLSASSGEVKWEHYQKRAPLNVDIRDNTIQLVFKKEVQVLKFIAF